MRPVDKTPRQDTERIHGWRLLALLPVAGCLRLLTATLRFRFAGDARAIMTDTSVPSVFIFWHNRLIIAATVTRRYRKKRPMAGLVSGSKDGAWLAAFFRLVGIRSVRGSRHQRATQALRDLMKAIQDGCDVAITPDGSRGPIYKAKKGSLLVAEKTGSPVVLVSATFSRARRLRSWDGFYIPLPFSEVTMHAERWENVAALAATAPEQPLDILDNRLMAMTEDLPMPER